MHPVHQSKKLSLMQNGEKEQNCSQSYFAVSLFSGFCFVVVVFIYIFIYLFVYLFVLYVLGLGVVLVLQFIILPVVMIPVGEINCEAFLQPLK